MMDEPTVRQYQVLLEIKESGEYRNSHSEDLKHFWELVRMGYLKNLVTFSDGYDWRFKLTDLARKYLKELEAEKTG